MAQIQRKFLAPNAADDTKIRLNNTGFLRSRNQANTGDVQILSVDAADIIQFASLPRNATVPTNNAEFANKAYVDSEDALKVSKTGDSMTGTLNMLNNPIVQVANPLNNGDAANKFYVDNQDALKVSKSGDVMSGNLDMQNNKVVGLAAPSANNDATNKLYVDNQDALKVAKSGDSMTGNLDMGGNRVRNVADCLLPQDVATKAYVDAHTSGLDPKQSCRVVDTVGNVDVLVGGLVTIDGVVLNDGDRVLLNAQTLGQENGIWVAHVGSWTRPTDFNSNSNVTPDAFTFIQEGTTYSDSGWVMSTNGPIVFGTTPLFFVQFSQAGVILAGDGLNKVGNTLNVVPGDASLFASPGDLHVVRNPAGAVGLSASGIAVNVDGTSIDISGNAVEIKPQGVTGPKLDPALAGNGLSQDGFGNLQVNTDGSTLEINADTLRIKAAGVTSNELNVSIAGDMIAGGAGSPLSVDLATVSGLESSNPGNVAGQLRVKLESVLPSLMINGSNQIGVKLDPTGAIVSGANGILIKLQALTPSLFIDGSDQLGVKLDPAGSVLSGVSGVYVNLEASNPSLKISGNQLGLKIDPVGALLSGASGVKILVDPASIKINGTNQLETLKGNEELLVLGSTDIANQYVDLAHAVYGTSGSVNSIEVSAGGVVQLKGTDYLVTLTGGAGGVTRIGFLGDLATGGGAALTVGDVLTVEYEYL